MIVIGIDPGVTTGVAKWDTSANNMVDVSSMKIHQAMDMVGSWPIANLVLVEDARKRTWFGKSGKEVWQGAGSIKRDCTVWEDFLCDKGISFVMLPPRSNRTKLNADSFNKLTGWAGRTNEHARDAAMLVYGMTDATVQSLLRSTDRRNT